MITESEPKIAVLGLGNLLMGDDGAGVHAVRLLRKDPPHGAVVAEIGTAILRAQDILESVDLAIAIDAADIGAKPGETFCFEAVAAEKVARCSLHGLGILGLLRLMPAEKTPRVIVLGVQPEKIHCSTELSDSVRASLARLTTAVRTMVKQVRAYPSATLDLESFCACNELAGI